MSMKVFALLFLLTAVTAEVTESVKRLSDEIDVLEQGHVEADRRRWVPRSVSNLVWDKITNGGGQQNSGRSSGPSSSQLIAAAKALAAANALKTGGTYIGCYTDDQHRDLNYGPKKWGYNAATCSKACIAWKYFALQANGWCACGNAYATRSQYQKRPDAECGATRLGGNWRNAVFANPLAHLGRRRNLPTLEELLNKVNEEVNEIAGDEEASLGLE